MENENKTPQTQEPKGWRDVVITPEMPLGAIVQFFNILNQRLCTIEDNLVVETNNGDKLTLSELYRIQAEVERQAQSENKGE